MELRFLLKKDNNCMCISCGDDFIYNVNDVIYNESGFGYSTKLVYCPYCKKLNILEYIEDVSMDLNNDFRYY